LSSWRSGSPSTLDTRRARGKQRSASDGSLIQVSVWETIWDWEHE
jgi:hypothetical protein